MFGLVFTVQFKDGSAFYPRLDFCRRRLAFRFFGTTTWLADI